MSPEELKVLTLPEVAAQLRCSVGFVRSLLADEEMPYLKCGKRFCVLQGDVNRWLERARSRQEPAKRGQISGKSRVSRAVTPLKPAS